jgi:hypothetical protein
MLVSSFQVEEVGCYRDEHSGRGQKSEFNEEFEKCKDSVYVNVPRHRYFIEEKRNG